MQLLTTSNPKTQKSVGYGYLTGILHLAPHKRASTARFKVNTCPDASIGCRRSCLNTAGRGRFDNVQRARINRTRYLVREPLQFLGQLGHEIEALQRKADRMQLLPAIRLNGTSDIAWERLFPKLFSKYAGTQFYDYTKSTGRMLQFRRQRERRRRNAWLDAFPAGGFPRNYHLTYSRSEDSHPEEIRALIKLGCNVALVFEEIPAKYAGIKVVDGMASDLRFLDPEGRYVGLRAIGKAKQDRSGFVIRDTLCGVTGT